MPVTSAIDATRFVSATSAGIFTTRHHGVLGSMEMAVQRRRAALRRKAKQAGFRPDGELKKFFPETLAKIGRANGLDAEGAYRKVIEWYDGYRFEENAELVVNPVSFGLCAENGKFQNYWANTATPPFLIDAQKDHPLDFSTIVIAFSSERRTISDVKIGRGRGLSPQSLTDAPLDQSIFTPPCARPHSYICTIAGTGWRMI